MALDFTLTVSEETTPSVNLPVGYRTNLPFVDAVLDLGCVPTHVSYSQETASRNTAILNAWAQSCKKANTWKQLWISDRIAINDSFVLPNVTGLHIHFAGGQQLFTHELSYTDGDSVSGHCAALIWVGEVGGSSPPMIVMEGHGTLITGGVNLQGVLLPSSIDESLIEPHSTKLPSVAILIQGMNDDTGTPEGLGTGIHKFPDALHISGFQTGIKFGSAYAQDNADQCIFNSIMVSHVDTIVHVLNRQSVNIVINYISGFPDGSEAEAKEQTMFLFDGGGKVVVNHCNLYTGLLCKVRMNNWNTGQMIVHNLSLDPARYKSYRIFDGTPTDPNIDNPFHLIINSCTNGVYPRLASNSVGPMIKAVGGQRLHLRGFTFFEAVNGASIVTLDADPIHPPSGPRARPEICFTNCEFDQCIPADLFDGDNSDGLRTFYWRDCITREGVPIDDDDINVTT